MQPSVIWEWVEQCSRWAMTMINNGQLSLSASYVLGLALRLYAHPLVCLGSMVYVYTRFSDEETKAQSS